MYSTSTFEKLSVRLSWMTSPLLPPCWYPDTRMSDSLIFRYSCCLPPALRNEIKPVLMCSPLQHLSIKSQVAVSTFFVKVQSWTLTLPAPPPPPPENVP